MIRLVMSLIVLAMFWVGSSAAEVAKRTDSWTTLEVPPEHARLGRVYYVKYPPHSAQVTFVSDAPIERIVGTSNAVVGYVVAEMENDRPTGRIVAGAFLLAVSSIDSGISMRNGHLRGRMFFNAAEPLLLWGHFERRPRVGPFGDFGRTRPCQQHCEGDQ